MWDSEGKGNKTRERHRYGITPASVVKVALWFLAGKLLNDRGMNERYEMFSTKESFSSFNYFQPPSHAPTTIFLFSSS